MKVNDKEKEAFKLIEEGVKEVFSSSRYKEYLKVLSKFHTYSYANVMLIMSQCPNASYVTGYKTWQKEFNRTVNKGEKAIKIFAPCKKKLNRQKEEIDENGNKIIIEEVSEYLSFRLVNVFDISQTSGEPLINVVSDLKGSSDNALRLIKAIHKLVEINIIYKESKEDDILNSGAKGYYSVMDNNIVIDKNLEDKQKVKTLIHEYIHYILHADDEEKDLDVKEIEAESLAFVICNYFNIDTSDYSFPYVATYLNEDVEELKGILNNIQKVAHSIIEEINMVYQKI